VGRNGSRAGRDQYQNEQAGHRYAGLPHVASPKSHVPTSPLFF
jgi:hypothetical protein